MIGVQVGYGLLSWLQPLCRPDAGLHSLSSSMGGIGCLKINFEIAFLFMCGRYCRVSLD